MTLVHLINLKYFLKYLPQNLNKIPTLRMRFKSIWAEQLSLYKFSLFNRAPRFYTNIGCDILLILW